MRLVSDYIADLKKEFAGYNGTALKKDILSGVTTGAVALPLALAFGVSSGADAASGMIAAIVSAFLIGALSGASYQISGPTGAMAAILVPLSARYGLETMFAAGAVAGVLLILIGLFRMGKLVNLLPTPVIAGFTSGIALLIALGQLDNLLGVKTEGENAVGKLASLFADRPAVNLAAILFGILVAAFIFLWPVKLNKLVPGSLVAVALATVIQGILKLPVAMVGEIPRTLVGEVRLTPAFLLSNPQLWNIILLPGVSIAMLCLIESLLCGVVGGRMKGESLNADRELVAQGVGNFILPFLGGVPSTAAIARTSVAIRSGAVTRLTGVLHGVFLLASMFLLSPFISRVPLSALAGVLIVTSWRMNEWENIRYLFKRRFRGAITKFLVTLIATVAFDLTVAIGLGCIVAVVLFVARMSNLDVAVSAFDPSRMEGDLQLPVQTEVAYITGPLFFGSVDKLERGLAGVDAGLVILSMRGVPSADVSAVQSLLSFCKARINAGRRVAFSCLSTGVREMLDRGGVTELVGGDAYFPTTGDAIMKYSVETARQRSR